MDTPLVTSSLVSAVVQILHLFPSPHYKELSVGAWLGTVLSLVGPEPPATHIKELTLGGSTSMACPQLQPRVDLILVNTRVSEALL